MVKKTVTIREGQVNRVHNVACKLNDLQYWYLVEYAKQHHFTLAESLRRILDTSFNIGTQPTTNNNGELDHE